MTRLNILKIKDSGSLFFVKEFLGEKSCRAFSGRLAYIRDEQNTNKFNVLYESIKGIACSRDSESEHRDDQFEQCSLSDSDSGQIRACLSLTNRTKNHAWSQKIPLK